MCGLGGGGGGGGGGGRPGAPSLGSSRHIAAPSRPPSPCLCAVHRPRSLPPGQLAVHAGPPCPTLPSCRRCQSCGELRGVWRWRWRWHWRVVLAVLASGVWCANVSCGVMHGCKAPHHGIGGRPGRRRACVLHAARALCSATAAACSSCTSPCASIHSPYKRGAWGWEEGACAPAASLLCSHVRRGP